MLSGVTWVKPLTFSSVGRYILGEIFAIFLGSNPFLFFVGDISIDPNLFFSGMAQRRRGCDSYTPYICSSQSAIV